MYGTVCPHNGGHTASSGGAPIGELTQGTVDWREQIDIGVEREPVPAGEGVADYWRLEGPNQWPDALPVLKDVVTQ